MGAFLMEFMLWALLIGYMASFCYVAAETALDWSQPSLPEILLIAAVLPFFKVWENRGIVIGLVVILAGFAVIGFFIAGIRFIGSTLLGLFS